METENKKKILVVRHTIRNKSVFKRLVGDALEKRNCLLKTSTFDDICMEINGAESSLIVDGKNIKEFDLVYFRGVNETCSALVSTMCQFLDREKIDYIDKAWKQIGPRGDKLTFLANLNFAGLPVPQTIYYPKATENNFSELEKSLGLPFVAKDLVLQRGVGVFLIRDLNDFRRILEFSKKKEFTKYVFQKYIDRDKEYRLLVLGKQVGVWEEKVPQVGEFRSNAALGAEEKFLSIDEIPEEYSDIAIKSADVLNLQVAGVDIVIQKGDKKIFVFEVNRGPGITYGDKTSYEVKALADYLSK